MIKKILIYGLVCFNCAVVFGKVVVELPQEAFYQFLEKNAGDMKVRMGKINKSIEMPASITIKGRILKNLQKSMDL